MLLIYTTLLKAIYRARFGEPPDLSSGQECHGLVLVADGVGGLDLCGTGLRYVIGAMKVPYIVKVVSWGHGFGRWHADLTNAANRDLRAREIAHAVVAFRQAHPGAATFLVGKSGGTGLIVKALEHLDADAVETVVLLSPALSPTYDLTHALRAVRREMVVFWSPLDVIVLGVGTRIFGTIDRIKTISAGMVGFRSPHPHPGAADRDAAYRKLRQVRWRPQMAATGYLGGHVGPDNPAFLRKYVVPLLRVGEPESR
jgi:pimeloyl-ACP methyl ester carboxylesterase